MDNRRRYGVFGAAALPRERWRRTVVTAEWTTHVMVLGEVEGEFVVGVQRNREGIAVARLERADEDRLADSVAFRERLEARSPERFADGYRIDPDGTLRTPPTLAREWPSKTLWTVSETPPLREARDAIPGFDRRVAGRETIDDERCARIEGRLHESAFLSRPRFLPDTVRATTWFCPSTGLARRVELEGAYPDAGYREVRHEVVVELVGRQRGEAVPEWLGDPRTRQGALAGLLVSPVALDEAGPVRALVEAEDPEVARRALAVLHRSDLPPPSVEVVRRLLDRSDPRIRSLAVRMLERVEPGSARPLLERAIDDDDPSVRHAVRTWMRRRLPSGTPLGSLGPEGLEALWGELEAPRDPDGEIPACAEPGSWLRAVVERRLAGSEPPGTRLRRMDRADRRPYGVRIPLDYTGAEPFPLLIYLSGNAGPLVEGVQLGEAAVRDTGYLVVYPQANGFWWMRGPTATVDALIREVVSKYNVDPDRVYLSGLSNGGTGVYHYAALWPHRFTAAVSAMGGGHLVYLDPEARRDAEEPVPRNTAHLPFLFLHGGRDRTIDPRASELTAEAMRPRWAELDVRVFPERGHGVVLGRGDGGMTLEFFARHLRRAMPTSIRFRTRSLTWPRHYWVEVLEKGTGDALVEGSIGPKGTISLRTENVERLRLLLHPDLVPSSERIRVEANGVEVHDAALEPSCALAASSYRETGDPWLAWAVEIEVRIADR